MRKILYNGILCLFLCLAFSCSQNKQPEPTAQSAANNKTRNNKSATALSISSQNFINTFYSNASYTVGRQEQTQDGAANYLVSEIIVTGNARGYLVTNQANGAPLFFADVDRTNYKMVSVDITANETNVTNNINQNAMYAITGDFDFVGFVKTVNENPTQYTVDKFWGWGKLVVTSGGCVPSPDGVGTIKVGYKEYYVFGIVIKGKFDYERC